MSAPVSLLSASAFQAAVFRALQASITNNQMVEFARYAQLATINAQGIPTVRTINIRKLSEDPHTKQGVLLFSTDARSSKIDDFAHMMSHESSANANPNHHSPLVELCWFFPVTREQYRLRCRVALVYSSSDAFTASNNNLAAPATLPTPNPAPATPTVSTSSLRAAALTPIVLNVSPSISAEERTAREAAHKTFWADHAENSRALFEIARPGTVKKRVERAEQHDLDRYEPQELSADRPSANFVSVHLIPIRCDYLKLPRPEEDTRGKIQKVKHSHESQLQPTRQQSRWLHTLDENTGEWKAVAAAAVKVTPAPPSLPSSVNSEHFFAASGDDTVGFQTLVNDDKLCDLPSKLLTDALDSSVFFVSCQDSFLRVRIHAVSNITGQLGQAVRVIFPVEISIAIQILDEIGNLFIVARGMDVYASVFYLSDREGLMPPQTFVPQNLNSMEFTVRSAVADGPWTTRLSLSSTSSGAIYYIAEQSSSDPETTISTVMKLQINNQSPNQSLATPAFSPNISNSVHPIALYIQPSSHLLFALSHELILEYDIVRNSTRIIFNLTAAAASADSLNSMGMLMITQVTMSSGTNEMDSDVLFITLSSESVSTTSPSMPLIFRFHRSSSQWETLATASTCLPGLQLSAMMFSAIDQTLFISCEGGTVKAASFNGSFAYSSTVASFTTITNPVKCYSSDIIRLPTTPQGSNVVKLVIACTFQNMIISTIGASLSQTVPYVLCPMPNVISSNLDEYGRQVLLHDCGTFIFPVVLVDGRPKQLTALCNSASALLHRAGTSEVYALCEPFGEQIYIAVVRTDNTNLPKQHMSQQPQNSLFLCPPLPFSNADGSFGPSQTFFSEAVFSGNSSLVFTCSNCVWSLPLSPAVGTATMLLNLTDASVVAPENPVQQIIGVLASSHYAFVDVVFADSEVSSVFAVEIPQSLSAPAPVYALIDGENVVIDEAQNAIWYDRCIGSFWSGTHCSIYRQQPMNDFSLNARQLVLNMSMLFRAWTVDARLNRLIVVTNNAELWSMPAYNVSIAEAQAALVKIPVIPSCLDTNLPMSDFVSISIRHQLGLFLLPCEVMQTDANNPDWLVAALPLAAITNSTTTTAISSTSISASTWLPFLRGNPDCALIDKPFVIGEQEDIYVHCGISLRFSSKFQCAPGQQWLAGECAECISGWSKSMAVDDNDDDAPTVLSVSSDRSLVIPQCIPCAPGSIAVSAGSHVCLPCSAGTYHDSSLGEVCRPCPTGSYQNTSGNTACIPCESGTYAPSQGSLSCSTCPLGSLPDPLAVTCVPCPRGSYAPSAMGSQCVSCEGSHQSGLDCSNGLASVREGYFAFLVDESDGTIITQTADADNIVGVFHSASCAYGYCPGSPLQAPVGNANTSSSVANSCPSDDLQSGPIHWCCWPRLNSPNNLLCANCADGHIPWASTCAACTGANGGLIAVLLIFSIALVGWLYSNASNSASNTASDSNTSGHVTILLYFIQISSLQLGHASDWLQWMHWSNLSASSTKGCIAPIDAYEQTAMNLAVPFILTAIMLTLGIFHIMFDRCVSKFCRQPLVEPENAMNPMHQRQHRLHQPFLDDLHADTDSVRELQDVSYDSDRSSQFDVHSSRSSSAWNSNNNEAKDMIVSPERIHGLASPLSGSYSSSAWYWNAFVLLRRVLFSACAVFLADSPNTRFPLFTMMHFASLLMHQLAAPYADSRLNFVECGSYSLLLAVSILLSMESPPYPLWFEAAIVTSMTIATLCMIGWIAWIKLHRLIRRNKEVQPSRSVSDERCTRVLHMLRTLFTPSAFSIRRYFRTFLLILLFCYTSVTSTVLSFLHCVDVSSDVRLVFDTPTMDCRSDRYHMYRVWVILVLVVYTFGFPVATLAFLAWIRKAGPRLNDRPARSSLLL